MIFLQGSEHTRSEAGQKVVDHEIVVGDWQQRHSVIVDVQFHEADRLLGLSQYSVARGPNHHICFGAAIPSFRTTNFSVNVLNIALSESHGKRNVLEKLVQT